MADVTLMHRAFSGGFVWQEAADKLRAWGYRTWTPDPEGC